LRPVFTNILGTIRLLEFSCRMKVSIFILALVSNIYGPETQLPADEVGPANAC